MLPARGTIARDFISLVTGEEATVALPSLHFRTARELGAFLDRALLDTTESFRASERMDCFVAKTLPGLEKYKGILRQQETLGQLQAEGKRLLTSLVEGEGILLMESKTEEDSKQVERKAPSPKYPRPQPPPDSTPSTTTTSSSSRELDQAPTLDQPSEPSPPKGEYLPSDDDEPPTDVEAEDSGFEFDFDCDFD